MQRPPLPNSGLDTIIDEILSGNLPPNIKQDALKVLQCTQYIRDNLEAIAWQVDHRHDSSIYRFPEDKQKGVLRDTDGTSFHINGFTSGEEARRAFQQEIDLIEQVLTQLTKTQRQVFTQFLRYDKQSGCLAARLNPALKYAQTELSPSLKEMDHLMQVAAIIAKIRQCSLLNALNGYCYELGITECLYNKKTVPVTQELFAGYIRDVLFEDPATYTPTSTDAELKNAYARQVQQLKPHILLGRSGMVQLHFASHEAAEQLVSWLKQQELLHAFGINKASVKAELVNAKQVHIVRLTQEQYECLTSSGSYDKLRASLPHAAQIPPIPKLPQASPSPARVKKFNLMNVQKLSEQEFINAVNAADAAQLDEAIVKQTSDGWTGLHEVAKYQSESGFILLVNKASAAALSAATAKHTKRGWTGLHVAAENQSETGFTLLINKVSVAALNVAISKRNANGLNGLHAVVRNQSEAEFMLLVDKVSTEALDAAIVMGDTSGDLTVLHEVIRKYSEQGFLRIVNKLSVAVLEAEIIMKINKDRDGVTNLEYVAAHKTGAGFVALVNKLSAAVLDAAMVHPFVFNIIANKQSEAGFILLVNKLSTATLDAVIVQPVNLSSGSYTALGLLARYQALCQSEAGMLALLNKLSASSLGDALYRDPMTLDNILKYHSRAAIKTVLSKIDDTTLALVLNHLNTLPSTRVHLIGYVLNDPDFQSEILVKRLFGAMKDAVIDHALQQWKEGRELPKTLQAVMQQHLSTYPEISPLAREWLACIADEEAPLFNHIITGRGRTVALDDPHIAELVWVEGLRGYRDYRLLTRHPDPELKKRLSALSASGKLMTGSAISYALCQSKERADYEQACQAVLVAHRDASLFLKTIKDKDWPDMLKQFGDYEYRAVLRKNPRQTATHKYVHLTKQIVPHKAIVKPKAKPPHTHTKKTSVTLLSSSLNNGIFGDHDHKRDLVGILIDSRHTKIKAMLTRDRGTYQRNWIGSQQDVQAYAKELDTICYTQFNEFKAYIEQHPLRLNEVLGGLSREGVLGIIIVNDNKTARKTARQRRLDLQNQLHRAVPIFFLDRAKRIFKPYTLDEIYSDECQKPISHLQEAESKNKLLKLKAELANKKDWVKHTLLGRLQGRPAELSAIPTSTTQKILSTIQQAEVSVQFGAWIEADEKIAALLKQDQHFLQAKETTVFYDGLRKKYY